jgi:DNA-binding NtrC family response regulator
VYNKDFNKKVQGIAGMAERIMTEYSWPGNVRELKNVIERAIILGNDETLLLEHLPLEIVAKTSPQNGAQVSSFRLPPEGIDIEEVEKELIRQALEITEWNQSKAAKKLNLGIDAFRYRMKKFGYLK